MRVYRCCDRGVGVNYPEGGPIRFEKLTGSVSACSLYEEHVIHTRALLSHFPADQRRQEDWPGLTDSHFRCMSRQDRL